MKKVHGVRGLAFLALAASTLALAQQRSPFDIPYPPKSPPFRFLNEHGQEVECATSPWQRVDLGTIAGKRIYAGDHCSMPSPDPLSEKYKQVFSNSCDLHDICYFAPGNTKRFCDDMLKWHTDRDCERAPNGGEKLLCRTASAAWRKGLDTPVSTQYWNSSQNWGRQNCRLNPPIGLQVRWMAIGTGALPADAVRADAGATASAVCHAGYQGGEHPGRVSGSTCDIGYGGREWGIGGEVLVAKADKVAWVPYAGTMPPRVVVGGTERGTPLVVCRARHENVYYAGKLVGAYCNVGYGGKELTLRPLDVLVVR